MSLNKNHKKVSCVYFLIKKRKVIYIGQNKHFYRRIKQHAYKDHDTYRFIECHSDKLLEYESRWINRFKPKLNSKLGRKKLPKGEKIVTIILYVRGKDLLNAGGRVVAKEKAINAILGI